MPFRLRGMLWACAIAAGLFAPARASGTEQPTRPAEPDGKALFTEKTCVTCHAIGGPSAGAGPELTQVALHRDHAWLVAWLTDPPAIKKDTDMPRLKWDSPDQMETIIAYLVSAQKPVPAADSSDGQKLFADYRCGACHRLNGKGGKPQFSDLTALGKKRDAATIEKWISDPQGAKKGTFMPAFKLSTAERGALVKFLYVKK